MKARTFAEKVRDVVKQIQPGNVLTYGAVARKAGNPKAARAVGAVLRKNYDPLIPCHRVVAQNGALTGYNRGLDQKAFLLEKEGATKALLSLQMKARK